MARGLAYAEACFETMRVIHGHVFAWQEHMQRLQCGLQEYGYSIAEEDIKALHQQVLQAAAKVAEDALVRITAGGGEAAWGLSQTSHCVQIDVQAMPVSHPAEIHLQSLQADDLSHLPRSAKFTADYALCLRWLGKQSLSEGGMPLLCDDRSVLSGLTANVLIRRQDQWFTPVLRRGILPGLVRAALVRSGHVQERTCPVSWLKDCDAMMLSNCGFFLLPVQSIDGRDLPTEIPAMTGLRDALRAYQGVSL